MGIFDLIKDPHEFHNTIDDNDYDQIIEEMKQQLVLKKKYIGI